MPDFKVTVARTSPAPGAVEIELFGSIVSSNIATFQGEVDRLIKPDVRVVIMIMKDVSHVSSAPLAYLVAIADRLERQGGLIILAQTQQKILQIMDTLGLRRLFKIVAASEEARSIAQAHADKLSKSPKLVQLIGGQPGLEYPILSARLTIGSDPKSTIVLNHHQVEQRHAEVYRSGDQVMVKDLGSRYGTFVDGKRIAEAALPAGKSFTVASFLFRCVAPAAK